MKLNIKKTLLITVIFCAFVVFLSPVQAKSAIKLNMTKTTLNIGESVFLKVTGTTKKAKWSSDDPWIASVNKHGKVTAKDEGKTTIYAEIEKKILKCKVTVKYPEIKGNRRIIYIDKNVSIMYNGITGRSDGYNINLEVTNFSNRSISILNRETSINGYMMNEAFCSIDVSPRKKAKDGIKVLDSEAEEIPITDVKDIETKFRICDDEDEDFDYETKTIQIIGESSGSSIVDYTGENLGFEKDLARKSLKAKPYIMEGGAVAVIESTYDINTEVDIDFAFYNSFGKLVDSQKAECVQIIKGKQSIAYVRSERSDISKVTTVISDVRKGEEKYHPEKITFSNSYRTKSGVSSQVNNIGDEDFSDVKLSCVFIENGKPVGYSAEYIEYIQKNSHRFVTFDVPNQKKYVKDSFGDWDWDYVPIDFDKCAVFVEQAYYD